jgi:predicted phage terminase large subunit-like protein
VASELVVTGPQPGPQTMFAQSRADVAICGGSFFGGKSVSILMEAARNIDHPRYRGVVFRRTFPQITDAGGLADIAAVLYPVYGGVATENRCKWTFPSGAQIKFNHLQYDADMVDYRSSQFSFLGIDQVEEFGQKAVFFLIARTRPSPGYNRRTYVRLSCNPEPGWLADFIQWWWDQKTGYPIKERAGVIRHYTQQGDNIVWVDKDWLGPPGPDGSRAKPLSLSLIPSTMYDNTIGMKNDPTYVSRVSALDPVAVERYIKGNWLVSYSGGIFITSWFKKIRSSELPADIKLLRYWDFAASEVKEGKDPDWNSGALCGLYAGDFYIIDVYRFRENPGVTIERVITTAFKDGPDTAVRWEEEKGSAGSFNTAHLTEKLIGFNAKGDKVKGDKVERAKPLAEIAYKGRVYIVEAPWNNDFIAEVGTFPKKTRDIVDSITGNLKCLTTEKRVFPNFSISSCKSFKINWKKALSTSIVYGSYYQAEDNSIYLVSAVYDQYEDLLLINGVEHFNEFSVENIAHKSIKLLNMKSSQKIRVIGNENFIAEDPVKKSANKILSEYINLLGIRFNATMPIAYDESGSIQLMNTMLFHENVLVHKSQIEMAADISSWVYVEGRLEEKHCFCRSLLYILSDIRHSHISPMLPVKPKDYNPVLKPKHEAKDSWQTV